MKFIIINGIDKNVKCKIKDAYYVSEDYDDACATFKLGISNREFKHAYLIADFEIYKTSILKYTILSLDKSVFPFLIIAEYHYGEEFKPKIADYARKDNIILHTDGFDEEFYNNYIAMTKFLYYLDFVKDCTMNISYLVNNVAVTKLVANTSYIIRSSKKFPISKIVINPIAWEPNYGMTYINMSGQSLY